MFLVLYKLQRTKWIYLYKAVTCTTFQQQGKQLLLKHTKSRSAVTFSEKGKSKSIAFLTSPLVELFLWGLTCRGLKIYTTIYRCMRLGEDCSFTFPFPFRFSACCSRIGSCLDGSRLSWKLLPRKGCLLPLISHPLVFSRTRLESSEILLRFDIGFDAHCWESPELRCCVSPQEKKTEKKVWSKRSKASEWDYLVRATTSVRTAKSRKFVGICNFAKRVPHAKCFRFFSFLFLWVLNSVAVDISVKYLNGNFLVFWVSLHAWNANCWLALQNRKNYFKYFHSHYEKYWK